MTSRSTCQHNSARSGSTDSQEVPDARLCCCRAVTRRRRCGGVNLPGLLAHRTVYSVDLLGEPGMSRQQRPISGSADQASWFDEMLTGLGLSAPHLMGVSFGGWSAANHAVHEHGRVASLTLLDPVMTFASIPIPTMLAVIPMGIPGAPEFLRKKVVKWISGGADLDESVAVASLIAAGAHDFVMRQPLPTRFTPEQLKSLDIPVLALIAGRSVIHDARRAAETAAKLLPRAEVELWPHASHAISGEYADEIGERAHRFWNRIDSETAGRTAFP